MTADQGVLAQRYALESSIASGGMATVWRARDDVLARPVAVKILHPQLAEDDAFVERFRREALSAARLSHPHIVSIYDTGSEASDVNGIDCHFIVMEFCGGGTLGEVLRAEGALPPGEAAEVVAVVCDALAYAHRHGIVHRDIKPQNVLLNDQRTLKVADFGIAKAAFSKTDITATGAILGTVTYLSPEQVLGREPGPRSDIYSVGILLHELLTGAPPFQADTQIGTAMAHARTDPPPVRTLRPAIPRSLEQIVLRALAKDPADRFDSAADMASALRNASDSSTTGVLDAPVVPRTARRAKRSRGRELRWLVPLLLLIAAAVAAAFFVPSMLETEEDVPATESPPDPPAVIQVRSASAFDTLPDETEHPEEAPNAIDGDPTTTWSTETYETPMHELKEGVGLVMDLGRVADVAMIRLQSPTPGYSLEVRAADEPAATPADYEEVTDLQQAPKAAEIPIDPALEGRYWMLLLTRLPDDGAGAAEIGEVDFFGP